jgi:hypothetical protein
MQIAPGSHLGPYEIISLAGVGGMVVQKGMQKNQDYKYACVLQHAISIVSADVWHLTIQTL